MQVVKNPTLIPDLEDCDITDLTCGNSHTFAWSNSTQVIYGWGNGANGRLGNESDDIVTTPLVLESFREATQIGLMNIRQVSCGENHTLALVDMATQEDEDQAEYYKDEEDGPTTKLFVWGNNDKR